MSEAVLQVKGVSKRFGGLQALSDVGITIHKGQVYGLIGPNGAGKTTFFNVITGLYTPDSGSFDLGGAPYKPSAVHEVAKAGIARTFQNIRLFGQMSVIENVLVASHRVSRASLFDVITRTRRTSIPICPALSGLSPTTFTCAPKRWRLNRKIAKMNAMADSPHA